MTNKEHADYLEVIHSIAALLEAITSLDPTTRNGQETIRHRYENIKACLMNWGIE